MSRQKKTEYCRLLYWLFSQCDDPQRVWIGEIIETAKTSIMIGRKRYRV